MVQRKITRRTFEHKLDEAEERFKAFEETICSTCKWYMDDTMAVAEDLYDMADLDHVETYYIKDEDTLDEYPVFASRKQVCDYLYVKGVICSASDLEKQCNCCEIQRGTEECMRMRHTTFAIVMSQIQELNQKKTRMIR